jgi:hypothetical protein
MSSKDRTIVGKKKIKQNEKKKKTRRGIIRENITDFQKVSDTSINKCCIVLQISASAVSIY